MMPTNAKSLAQSVHECTTFSFQWNLAVATSIITFETTGKQSSDKAA